MLTRSQDAFPCFCSSPFSTTSSSGTFSFAIVSLHTTTLVLYKLSPLVYRLHQQELIIRAENLLTHTRLLIGLVTTVIFPIATPRLGDALAVATLELVGAASPVFSCKVKKRDPKKVV